MRAVLFLVPFTILLQSVLFCSAQNYPNNVYRLIFKNRESGNGLKIVKNSINPDSSAEKPDSKFASGSSELPRTSPAPDELTTDYETSPSPSEELCTNMFVSSDNVYLPSDRPALLCGCAGNESPQTCPTWTVVDGLTNSSQEWRESKVLVNGTVCISNLTFSDIMPQGALFVTVDLRCDAGDQYRLVQFNRKKAVDGEICKKDSDCFSEVQKCTLDRFLRHICTCPSGYPIYVNGSCYEFARYGEPCKDTVQCQMVSPFMSCQMEPDNITRCDCIPGAVPDGNSCYPYFPPIPPPPTPFIPDIHIKTPTNFTYHYWGGGCAVFLVAGGSIGGLCIRKKKRGTVVRRASQAPLQATEHVVSVDLPPSYQSVNPTGSVNNADIAPPTYQNTLTGGKGKQTV